MVGEDGDRGLEMRQRVRFALQGLQDIGQLDVQLGELQRIGPEALDLGNAIGGQGVEKRVRSARPDRRTNVW
jgi:hypothetical protein